MVMKILVWVMAFAIPLYVIIAGGAGYEVFVSLPAAVLAFIGLLALAIITTVKKAPFRRAYIVSSVIMWVVSLGFPLTLDHDGDDASRPAPFESAGLSVAADSILLWVFPAASFLLWLATLIVLLRKRPTA